MYIYWCSVIITWVLFTLPGIAQKRDAATGAMEETILLNVAAVREEALLKSTNVSCSSQSFWSYDKSNTSEIREYSIQGNTISFTGNSIPQVPGRSLAICSNLNSGSFLPTLYSSSFDYFYFWDEDSGWVKTNPASNQILYNSGGHGKFLYSLLNNPDSTQLIRYDGAQYTTIYSTKKNSGCADIAVEENGNILLITSDSITSKFTDSLYRISPQGQLLKSYPLVFNKYNAYGCFLLGNVLYVGLGEQNLDFPNTILPILVKENNLEISTPIALPMGVVLTNDLASCFLPLVSDSIAISSLSYPSIFTPNGDGLNDAFAAIEKNMKILTCQIMNRWGVQLADLKEINSQWDGRTESGQVLPEGVYFFVANGTGADGKEYHLKGFTHLIR